MVWHEVALPKAAPREAGPVLLELRSVSTATASGTPLRDVSLRLHGGVITGIAGVSGNGQAALAGLLSGTLSLRSGQLLIGDAAPAGWSPRAALDRGVARIPEDRHAVGSVADMSVTENVISERYREKPFARYGMIDWNAARQFAERLIAAYDVKCPSPETRIRLLSGGNMQKLILGRALDPDPVVILANQPTRGLDIGAVAYVHARLIEARDRGAAVLLISEDLDEILSLSDRVHVIADGEISRPFARGEKSVGELGEMMAGHGLEAA
jgi:general nucleoside transport system ATP-binding protein